MAHNWGSWFKRKLFSNITIINPKTGDNFPAHGVCLGSNPFFEQLFSTMEKGISSLKTDPSGNLVIEVTNICIAEIYIKSIYTNTYIIDDININLENHGEIMDFLDYAEMWFMGNKIFEVNYSYILSNLQKIFVSNVTIIPELYTYFDNQYCPVTLREKIVATMNTSDHLLICDMFDWEIAQYYSGVLLSKLLATCTDVETYYKYFKKFASKIAINTAVEIAYGWNDIHKINDLLKLIEPEFDTLISQLIKYFWLSRNNKMYNFISDILSARDLSLLRSADHICKNINAIQAITGADDILVLENLIPFKGTMYSLIGKVIDYSGDSSQNSGNKSFSLFPELYLFIEDKLCFNEKIYSISEIYWGEQKVLEAFPLEGYYFKCRDCQYLPAIGTRVYKVIPGSAWQARIIHNANQPETYDVPEEKS